MIDTDIIAAINVLMPGVVIQRNLIDAAWNCWQAKGFIPLTAADVPGILAAANQLGLATQAPGQYPASEAPYTSLPAALVGLVRLTESNEAPDGWAADIGSLP